MDFCNVIAFLCCPRRFHRNNVLKNVDLDEIQMNIDEFEALYMESSRLVDVHIND
ncbi:unnamed protein product [Pylaiella littoralis]